MALTTVLRTNVLHCDKRRRDRSTTDSDRQEKESYRREFHRKPYGYSADAPVGRRGDLTSNTDEQVESTRRKRMSSKRHQRCESKSRHSRDRSVELSPRRHRNKSDEDSDYEVKSRRSSQHHSHKKD